MNRGSARTKVTATTITTKSSTQSTSTTSTLNRRRNHNQSNNTSILSSRKPTNSESDVIISNKQVILDLHKTIYTRMSHSYHHSHSSVALSSGGAGVMTSPELTETHKQSPNGRDSVLRLNHPHRHQHLQHQNNTYYQNRHVYHPPDLSWSFDQSLMRQTPKLIRLAALTHQQEQLKQRKHSISELPSSPSSSSSAAAAARAAASESAKDLVHLLFDMYDDGSNRFKTRQKPVKIVRAKKNSVASIVFRGAASNNRSSIVNVTTSHHATPHHHSHANTGRHKIHTE